MRFLLPTLHVRPSAQAVALAAANLKAALPQELQQQTQLLDLLPEQTDQEIISTLLSFRPELIAFPLYLWNRQQVLRICRLINKSDPDIILIAGGPEASADAASVIADGELDGVICGEGEIVFAELLKRLCDDKSFSELAGFKTPGFACLQSAPPPDLDQLPSPWLTETLPLQPEDGVLWEVARGCCFNCAFCFDAKGEQGVRSIPIERLKQELDLFVEKDVSQVWVLDSTFNAPPERGKQFLQLLIEQAPQIHFHLEAKADFLDRETAELLSQISCSVQIGLQSANIDILKPLHRSLSHKKMTHALQQLSQLGITYGLDLIYGLPEDNHAGFCESLNYALSQQPNQVDIFPLAVLPGTELFQKKATFGLVADPAPPYLVIENQSYSPNDLQLSQKLATATDIFYNRGRAVGFFHQLSECLNLKPADLLSKFANWLQKNTSIDFSNLSESDDWQPEGIIPLQQAFVAELLENTNKSHFSALLEDLINYHFCCAELILSEETSPPATVPKTKDILLKRWRLSQSVRLVAFHHSLEDLEEYGGDKISRAVKQITKEKCYGIFFQQSGEAIVESLQNNFAQLLLKADGQNDTEKLLSGQQRNEGLEQLEFAIAHGILVPAT